MYRQGDILLIPGQSIPAQAKRVDGDNSRHVLALGEVTGHAHVVEDDLGELVGVSSEVDRWLRVRSAGAAVVHAEHGAITLPVGDYVVRRQREYTPTEIRQSAD